uniref:Uncharacterized protein n=1 Tax=viral metagenome TaxID=1070528 RepID=A0A6M3XW56_9ZZZZ
MTRRMHTKYWHRIRHRRERSIAIQAEYFLKVFTSPPPGSAIAALQREAGQTSQLDALIRCISQAANA